MHTARGLERKREREQKMGVNSLGERFGFAPGMTEQDKDVCVCVCEFQKERERERESCFAHLCWAGNSTPFFLLTHDKNGKCEHVAPSQARSSVCSERTDTKPLKMPSCYLTKSFPPFLYLALTGQYSTKHYHSAMLSRSPRKNWALNPPLISLLFLFFFLPLLKRFFSNPSHRRRNFTLYPGLWKGHRIFFLSIIPDSYLGRTRKGFYFSHTHSRRAFFIGPHVNLSGIRNHKKILPECYYAGRKSWFVYSMSF